MLKTLPRARSGPCHDMIMNFDLDKAVVTLSSNKILTKVIGVYFQIFFTFIEATQVVPIMFLPIFSY